MSLHEEERQNKNCPSRWLALGLSAAAIGVGVGAALYDFISNRLENLNSAGSTQDFDCDIDNTLHLENSWQDDSIITISEYTTTDTSMNNTSHSSNDYESESMSENSSDSVSESESDLDDSLSDSDGSESGDAHSINSTISDFDVTDSDITSPVDLSYTPSSSPVITGYSDTRNATSLIRRVENRRSDSPSTTRGQIFRQRTWSLEECSICFDVILRDQEVMSLPCTHHFHTKCILPWLREHPTCPNCRKYVD